jgi:hypothetical protein
MPLVGSPPLECQEAKWAKHLLEGRTASDDQILLSQSSTLSSTVSYHCSMVLMYLSSRRIFVEVSVLVF